VRKALFAGLVLTAMAAAAEQKVTTEFDKIPLGKMVDVVVQFKALPTLANHLWVTSGGGKLKREFTRALNGGHYTIPAGLARILALSDLVKYISLDRSIKGSMEYANPTVYANLALSYGYTGTGIGVAVLDSGISTGTAAHPDLKGAGGTGAVRVVYSESFVPNDTSTNDEYGHGEHIAGIIGGNASQSAGGTGHEFRGIAPGVNLVNLRVLDRQGGGTDSAVIAAIDRAIALKAAFNIRIINLSLGRPVLESYKLDPLCQAVERAWKAGIAVVVAAGNAGRVNSNGINGYGTILSPANDPYVITVGAMRDMSTVTRADDLLASYSSKGPTALDHIAKPDLVAPGNQIVSLKLANGTGLAAMTPSPVVSASYYKTGATSMTPSSYMKLSGTSMAAPMVAGAAALLLQKYPTMTPDELKAQLMRTASKTFPSYSTYTDTATGVTYTQHYDVFSVGAGYLDVWAALNAPRTVLGGKRAASPQALSVPSVGVTLAMGVTIDGTNVIWGGDPEWGSDDVWGSTFFVTGTNVIWGGDEQVWGNVSLTGNSLLWGTNVIWGGDEGGGDMGGQSALKGDR